MSHLAFLFDECIDPDLIDGLLRREPAIDVLRVGWEGAPPRGTQDPEVIIGADAIGRMLITNDKQTMPQHLRNHYAKGGHTHGVMLLRVGFSFRDYIDALLLLWVASDADEWLDVTDYLPWD